MTTEPSGPQGAGARRRRRSRRGSTRPLSNASPQLYANPQGGPRPQGPRQRRRGRSGGGGGGGGGNNQPPKRRGLEMLRDLQQAGAALDPTERLILELPPGQGNPPYGDRTTGRAST